MLTNLGQLAIDVHTSEAFWHGLENGLRSLKAASERRSHQYLQLKRLQLGLSCVGCLYSIHVVFRAAISASDDKLTEF